MSTESLQFQSDITALIDELGEPLTFTRAGKKLAALNGAFGEINKRNIVPSDPSIIESEQKVVSIPYTKKYTPEITDVVQDSAKRIYQVTNVRTGKFQGTTICYILTIT